MPTANTESSSSSPFKQSNGSTQVVVNGNNNSSSNGSTTVVVNISSANSNHSSTSTGTPSKMNSIFKSMSPANVLSCAQNLAILGHRNRASSISLPNESLDTQQPIQGSSSKTTSRDPLADSNGCSPTAKTSTSSEHNATPPGSPSLSSGYYWRCRLNSFKNTIIGTPRFHRRNKMMQSQPTDDL